MKAWILSIAMLGLAVGPTLAGDAARLNVLGFNPDGKLFGFEEYGVQDGSGFPYANRFYIDTATDSFVAGTPIRVRLDDEQASENAARTEAARQGEKIVPDAQLSYDFLAGFNALTEESADPHRMVANPAPYFPSPFDSIGLRLEEIDLPVPQACELIGGPVKGFRLVRFNPATNADVDVLHEDKGIPASRNCPLGYRLTGLYTRVGPEALGGRFTIVIAVRSQGFEGPNHRYIAIAGRL